MKYITGTILEITAKETAINEATLHLWTDGITTRLLSKITHAYKSDLAAIPVIKRYINYYNESDLAAAIELTPDWFDNSWSGHTQEKRCKISNAKVSEISVSEYFGIISYIHSSSVELEQDNDGLTAYFNYILPEHEAILNHFNLIIETK